MEKEKQDKVVTLRNELSKIEDNLKDISELKNQESVNQISFKKIGYIPYPVNIHFCDEEYQSILDYIENILSEKANRLREELDNL